MAARGGGGRERFRRDYPYPPPQPRSSEGKRRGNAAVPSRHLWVGNLSNEIHESILTHHFQQFGDVESVAFQPGRSYAFINFKRDEDAIAAFTSLQGLPLAPGFPLKIEFAKAEKSSMPSRDEDYSRRDEPCFQRDSKARHASPEPFYPEKSRMSEKNAEPSEVLWIGFPALLKVDEMILRKAFSPFGEIEKITVFPGRSYAFVQFKSLMAACRAKETLQGKLFGNPRVHICFAKSESGSSHNGRSLINASSSPHSKPNGRQRFPDNIHQDEDFGSLIGDPSMRSPHFISSLESQDPEVLGFSRKGSVWEGGNNNFEHRRFPELRTEIGISEDIYERRSSPIVERSAHFRDFSPQNRPRRSPFFEDPWDLPEDASLFHGAKKLKTGSFLSEKELPEYPFSGSEQEKHVSPTMFSNFPQSMSLDKTIQYGSFGNKKIFNPSMNLTPPVGGMGDNWKVSHNSFQVGSASLPSNPIEWKWEGTIAKGGTPICRARCFPVGKVLDLMLPELLDCTARTGLDMLAKHYYQAANAWVVFFVPGSDADMGFYNEFMHYLGEKQRAAVTKLDEKNTLFLVPPSDFSEKVLKVPGKLSISGVVLRLEQPGSNFGTHHMQEKKDTNFTPFHGDASFPMPRSPPRPFPTMTSFPNIEKPGVNDKSFSGHLSTSAPPVSFFNSVHAVESHDSINENRRDYTLYQQNPTLGPTWSPYPLLNSLPGSRNVPSQASNDPIVHEQHATSSSHYKTGNLSNALYGSSALPVQESRPSVPMSTPIVALQPEQLAQLASSLLGQQKQSEKTLVSSTGTIHQSESSFIPSQRYGSELSTSQSGQVQQQQTSNVSSGSHSGQREVHNRVEGNQQMQSNAMQEEMEADPQKRLQATLQLAAALLQQIQQGKGT